jgi:hypothetical protein
MRLHNGVRPMMVMVFCGRSTLLLLVPGCFNTVGTAGDAALPPTA